MTDDLTELLEGFDTFRARVRAGSARGRGRSARDAYPQATRQQVNEKRSGDRSLAYKHKGGAATEGAFDA